MLKDLEAAYHITDIHEALGLSEVGNDRKMFLFGTQVTENGSEIPSAMQDAKDLIAHLAADMQWPGLGPLFVHDLNVTMGCWVAALKPKVSTFK